MLYNFKDSFKTGLEGEVIVQNYFKDKGFEVFTVPAFYQSKGLAFDFCIRKGHLEFYIEVKTETAAEKTGNLYFEFEVDNKVESGYIKKYNYHSKVIMVYYLPVTKRLIMFPAALFSILKTERLKIRECKNTTYNAFGYLVPLKNLLKSKKVKWIQLSPQHKNI